MTRRRRLVVITLGTVVTVALIAGAVGLVRARRAALAQAPAVHVRPLAVRLVTLQARPWAALREVPARFEEVERSELRARLTAEVRTVAVRVGDVVGAGQFLLALDDAEQQAQVAAAGAALAAAERQREAGAASVEALRQQLAFAEREVARHDRLLAQAVVAPSQAEAVRDRRDQLLGQLRAGEAGHAAAAAGILAAAARLEEAELRLGFTRLHAPAAGVIAQRLIDAGDQAQPGRVLLVLLAPARHLVLDLPQADRPLVALGQELRSAEDAVLAQVSAIHPAVDDQGLFRVEATLAADAAIPSLPAGGTLHVRLVLARHPAAVAVPHEALVPRPDGAWSLFTVLDGRLQPLPVHRVGEEDGLVFVDGVAAGSRVVLGGYLGWSRLAAGLPVVELSEEARP